MLTIYSPAYKFIQVVNVYSVSECHDVAYENLTEFYYTKAPKKYAPVGKVIPGVKVAVFDMSSGLKRVPVGVPGEVLFFGNIRRF